MKKLMIITTVAVVQCLLLCIFSCKNSSSDSKKTEEKVVKVTETFEAQFIGSYIYFGPDTLLPKKCNDSLDYRIIVDCKGTSNIMGNIKVHFDFCGNEQGDYGNVYGYFVDESNDTLFIGGDYGGKVIEGKTEEHPSFVTSYWKDDFKLIGGTGNYEGATGKGMTDDYNSSEDPNSHHHWKGTITLVKESE